MSTLTRIVEEEPRIAECMKLLHKAEMIARDSDAMGPDSEKIFYDLRADIKGNIDDYCKQFRINPDMLINWDDNYEE